MIQRHTDHQIVPTLSSKLAMIAINTNVLLEEMLTTSTAFSVEAEMIQILMVVTLHGQNFQSVQKIVDLESSPENELAQTHYPREKEKTALN